MSEHFQLGEFLHSDTAMAQRIENLPSWADVENLKRVADTMERVRVILGSLPITITSGFRCPALNAAVGGVVDSAHLIGLACDFVCGGFGEPIAICNALQPHLVELGVDQLIMEGTWVHLGLSTGPPRHQCFSAI